MPPTAASITSIRALVVMSILINLEIIIYLVSNYMYQRMHLQRKSYVTKRTTLIRVETKLMKL